MQLPAICHRKQVIAPFLSMRQAVMDDPVIDPRLEIRFRQIDRSQTLAVDLEQLLAEDHSARLIVQFVEGLDFSVLYAAIKARETLPGASAFRPELLFSLWLFATVEGVPSARRLAVLCRRDLAYRWICGGPAPSYR